MSRPEPWHAQLLRIALSICGCDEAPSDAEPTFHVVVKPKSTKIYYDVEKALVHTQLRYKQTMAQARSNADNVAAACSALVIDEDRQRIAGAQRILPAWYKTRPQQHWQAGETATSSRGSIAQQPLISVLVEHRPSRLVGRTGVLVAREVCRAQFLICRADGLRAATPLRLKPSPRGRSSI